MVVGDAGAQLVEMAFVYDRKMVERASLECIVPICLVKQQSDISLSRHFLSLRLRPMDISVRIDS